MWIQFWKRAFKRECGKGSSFCCCWTEQRKRLWETLDKHWRWGVVFYSSFNLFLCFDLFEVIFSHLHHSLLPVLHSQQPKGNADKGKVNDQCKKKKKKRSDFFSQGPQMDHFQECYNQQFQPFSVYQGCDFYRTQPAAVYAFGFSTSTASSHNQKLSFNSFVKVPCCLLF